MDLGRRRGYRRISYVYIYSSHVDCKQLSNNEEEV